jgi:hypothetical protein
MTEQIRANGWELRETHVEGEHRGTLAVAGNEIHFVQHKALALTRKSVRETLGPLLNEREFLTTRVLRTDTISRRFVERLNFKLQWSDDRYDYFMLTDLPFDKGN